MTTENNSLDYLTPIVAKVMNVDDITWTTNEVKYIARFRGKLRFDSEEAYDELSQLLKPHKITPLFRIEDNIETILLLDGVIDPQPSNPWTNLVLFILTLISMLWTGAIFSFDGPASLTGFDFFKYIISNLNTGFSFAFSLLAILLAHEFGHYLAARYHKTEVTLPYFLPFPFPLSLFGTLGAFIRLKEAPRNKRILHDIGIAGPLAGFIVTVPILLFGLSLSELDTIPRLLSPGEGFTMEGNSIFYLAAKYLIYGELLPMPATYGDVSPLLYWVKFLFTGEPSPLGGTDVFLHPMAWAGWAGLLVTALNLMPAGQLDGGHLLFGLIGHRTKKVLPFILVILGLLGFIWQGWWLWAFLIFYFGRVHAEPLDQITKLDDGRKFLAIMTLLLFILIFTPVPLTVIIGGNPTF